MQNTFADVSWEKFISLGSIVGNIIAAESEYLIPDLDSEGKKQFTETEVLIQKKITENNEWFANYIVNKYKGIDFDFDSLVTLERLPIYNKAIRDCIKPLTTLSEKQVDNLANKEAFIFFGLIEPLYASLLLQQLVGCEPSKRMKGIICDGTISMLNTGVQIFGEDWKQKKMSAKSQSEIMDLALLFDEKTTEVRKAFDNVTKDVFGMLPMLAAVLTTPKYDEEKVLLKTEQFKKIDMQQLIDVFFYAGELLAKYSEGLRASTTEIKNLEVMRRKNC